MRQRTKNKFSTFFLVIILLVLGIGYAYLNTTLSINGVTDVDRNVWDIYFDNIQVTSGSVTGTQVIDDAEVVDDTTVEFHVNLKTPGDFYEFTVDAKNDGTIDAMINSISKKLNNVEITTLPAYLRYDVTYSDDISIANNHLLAAESLETYKIRVEYRTDINPNDLPSTAQSLTLSFGVEYVQANSNAIEVPRPSDFATDSWETIILAVQNGNTSAYNVGDTKDIELGNSLGTHTLRIANMSTPTECSNPGFSQTACGFVLEFTDAFSYRTMNLTATSANGWPATEMRTYLNNLNDSASFINSLPESLKNSIIDTFNISGHEREAATNYTSTDKIYFFSYVEIYGSNSNYVSLKNTDTRHLDFYSSIISSNYSIAIKKVGIINSYWWLRDATTSSYTDFRIVSSNGSGGGSFGAANNGSGYSPAFRLG